MIVSVVKIQPKTADVAPTKKSAIHFCFESALTVREPCHHMNKRHKKNAKHSY